MSALFIMLKTNDACVLRLRQILQQAVTEAALLQLQGPSARQWSKW